jgi:hypothetical protein
MKSPVVWVTASLTVAILVTATLLIATTTHGAHSSFVRPAGPLDMPTDRWPARTAASAARGLPATTNATE